MNAPETIAADFLLLRPAWLLALPLIALVYWLWRRARQAPGVWAQHVDAHLLPHLLVDEAAQPGTRGGGLLIALAAVLVVLALAGPSWRQQALPLWQQDAPLVIALDLSAAMRATDLAPSRLAQARAKIAALLKARRAGQVGLLVYAGEPYTVAPITPDGSTVAAFLDSLNPDLMPVEGQRADLAIAHALELLKNSGAARGDILLLTDQTDASAASAAQRAAGAGMRVSVIGVGTLAGAPLAGAQGFITDSAGKPRLARLDPVSLGALASAGGGAYQSLSIDDSDLRALGVLDPQSGASARASDASAKAGLQRSDDGYWLLLIAVPLLALAFRRGWLMSVPLLLCLTLVPDRPLRAADAPTAAAPAVAPSTTLAPTSPPTPSALQSFWDGLWQRSDQRAWQALQAGDAASARRLAQDPATRGAAAFREQDYEAAIDSWSGQADADGHYNRGNALASSGKLQEALAAYDEALKLAPGMEDAIANRKAVEDLLRQQQQQQQSGQSGKQQQDSQSQQQGQSQSGGQPEQQPQDGQQGESSPSQDEQQQSAQSGDPQSSEQAASQQAASQDQQGAAKDQASESSKSDRGEGEDASKPADAAQAPSAEQQQAAEQAAREQIEQALKAGAAEGEAEDGKPARVLSPEERAQAEREQALQQWLRRVPDDPGGLLRRKFELEHRRRQAEAAEDGQ